MSTTTKALESLVRLLLKENATRVIDKEAEKLQKDERMWKAAADRLALITKRQNQCPHLKGGRNVSMYTKKDYILSRHTFLDGHTEVKCLLCGKFWDAGDPVAIEMLRTSTNRQSSSEQPHGPRQYRDEVLTERQMRKEANRIALEPDPGPLDFSKVVQRNVALAPPNWCY
jgi:hypothetical protein